MPAHTHNTAAALIGLDWGTSSLRAYRMAADGSVLDVVQRPWGIMHLPVVQPDAGRDSAFEHALQDACGAWLQAEPALPMLAAGMVGSAQGWREAPYLDTPASLDDLAKGLTRVARATGGDLHIVAGLIQRGELPNVMRGEETQVLGVMADQTTQGASPVLIGLPGTHSKWVTARGRRIEHFDTFMTGEVFGALRDHTILGRTTQPAEAPDDAAFVRGLHVAQSESGQSGLLSNIFSTRTLGLTGALPARAQADYLSGVLIGHEVASLLQRHGPRCALPVVLCGEPDLCRRYALALQLCGFATARIAPNATARGLWQLAVAARLV